MRHARVLWAAAAVTCSGLFGLVDAVPAGDTTATAPTSTRAGRPKFDFGDDKIGKNKIRGVSVGGWLLLEPYITPSHFENAPEAAEDEWTFVETLGRDEARRRLEKHWSSFITADDFQEMADKGLNFVRIPIGYWSVSPRDGDSYVEGAYPYLGQALDWAEAAGLKVMIDLHGAVGSQNGWNHSGRKGDVAWGVEPGSVENTLAAVKRISDDHAAHPAVAAIEVLNEPFGVDMGVLRDFMSRAGRLVQKPGGVAVVVSEACLGPGVWNDWGAELRGDASSPLLVDIHPYPIFDGAGGRGLAMKDHFAIACETGARMADQSVHRVVAGEFSGALTDCARWLNGKGTGAVYDGKGPAASLASDEEDPNRPTCDTPTNMTDVANHIKVQMASFERAAGWIFWTWKTEGAYEWDFQRLVNDGVIPLPLGDWDHNLC